MPALDYCSNSISTLGQYFVRLPLTKAAKIVHGNSLRIDWETVVAKDKLNFILGYPPFIGKHLQNAEQKYDMEHIFSGVNGAGVLDYADIKGEPTERKTKNINPYLVEGQDLIILKRTKPICNIPAMLAGNKAIDGGNLIFDDDEKERFIAEEPLAHKYFRKFIGSDEFINGKNRWCLWLVDAKPQDLKQMPSVTIGIDNIATARAVRTDIEFLFGLYEALNMPLLKPEQKKKKSQKIGAKLTSE